MAFQMTKNNVLAIAHAFEHHPLNAKSIIKGLYGVTDREFLQLQSNWNFNQFMDFREKKKRKKADIKRADILRLATYGVEIAKKEKNVSIPPNCTLEVEDFELINMLGKKGWTIQSTTYEIIKDIEAVAEHK